MSGMGHTPDLNDPSVALVHRAMEAVRREFATDDQVPRFVMVAETPPDGRIGVASTGDDEPDTHRMLTLAAASVRSTMTPDDRRRARALWDTLRAGFERRN